MSRRIEQILELFQEQLEVDGHDADDIEHALGVATWDKPDLTLADLPGVLGQLQSCFAAVERGLGFVQP